MRHLVQLNEFGEFSLIWEKRGHFSFSKLHFLQSSPALASFPGGASGERNAFLALNDFVFFFPPSPLPSLAHIDTCLGT